MKTNNTEGLTMFEINVLIQQGGKFIIFPFIISKMVKKIKKSNIYFIRPNEGTFKYALKHFFLNVSLSWRIFPFAPIYIAKSLFYLMKGGKDYTDTILKDLDTNRPIYTPHLELSY
ncbi:hypothetical protein [Flavobacterium nitrogenifigens]|uniref:Uncharacterized protein n=1 Tax=Flavobacterium nitrogenifigens TaxID=1617283 RepID=A0A521AMT8_9FLAO|nr:hypothetical protein [Flavobacterium nitrogenifigens]KAF2339058.1 hypothetical protein DM397_01810 [Flavobacterium nitrogenifigens]SMO36123.1 hypothetical protein SAMN06265220_101298 [Flavobacterium nitrogenifigens]